MSGVLVVDLGGVAARFNPEARRAALSELTVLEPDEIDRALFRSGLDHAAERGDHTVDSLVAEIRALLGPVDLGRLSAAWSLAFEIDHDVLRVLQHRSERTVLLTNNGPMLDLCLAGPLRPLTDHFHQIICSWHLRARKPSNELFRRAQAAIGAPPNRLALFDDDPTNVAAARACGWHAVTYRSAADLHDWAWPGPSPSAEH